MSYIPKICLLHYEHLLQGFINLLVATNLIRQPPNAPLLDIDESSSANLNFINMIIHGSLISEVRLKLRTFVCSIKSFISNFGRNIRRLIIFSFRNFNRKFVWPFISILPRIHEHLSENGHLCLTRSEMITITLINWIHYSFQWAKVAVYCCFILFHWMSVDAASFFSSWWWTNAAWCCIDSINRSFIRYRT